MAGSGGKTVKDAQRKGIAHRCPCQDLQHGGNVILLSPSEPHKHNNARPSHRWHAVLINVDSTFLKTSGPAIFSPMINVWRTEPVFITHSITHPTPTPHPPPHTTLPTSCKTDSCFSGSSLSSQPDICCAVFNTSPPVPLSYLPFPSSAPSALPPSQN